MAEVTFKELYAALQNGNPQMGKPSSIVKLTTNETLPAAVTVRIAAVTEKIDAALKRAGKARDQLMARIPGAKKDPKLGWHIPDDAPEEAHDQFEKEWEPLMESVAFTFKKKIKLELVQACKLHAADLVALRWLIDVSDVKTEDEEDEPQAQAAAASGD